MPQPGASQGFIKASRTEEGVVTVVFGSGSCDWKPCVLGP